jgi:hypothetical protein
MDEKHTGVLLDLAKQHMQRCHELEDIGWRIKFSIWAFLGGLAYLWANAHIRSPEWVRWHATAVLFPLSLTVLHGSMLVWFGHRLTDEARLRDGYRRAVVELIGMDKSLYPDRGLTARNLAWALGEVLVTLMIAIAVLLVMRDSK